MSEWDQSIERLLAEFNTLLAEKQVLEDKLSSLAARIDSVVEASAILERLAGRVPSIGGALGETVSDKVRHVILRSETALTAVEIQDRLAKLGFQLTGPRPQATIHAILKRLTTARKPVIEVAPKRSGRRAWQKLTTK
jgi:hypothetical protein